MLLLADSGSSKTDWVLIKDHQLTAEFKTEGLNPVHISREKILQVLSAQQGIITVAKNIDELYFYGAGCGSAEGKHRMAAVLSECFPSAKINVDNDLMAAAVATCNHKPGIVSILGTGSNCCYYDGKQIHVKNFGLGYILGDEGSGGYFGKNFLKAFLYEQLPSDLSAVFVDEFKLDREKIIENVYRKPSPAQFFASMMPFLLANKSNAWVGEFFLKGLEEFFETNIAGFKDYTEAPLHFVGSVSYSLQEEIKSLCLNKGLQVGKIIKAPIEGMVEHYLAQQ